MTKLNTKNNLWLIRGDLEYFLEENIVAIYFDLYESVDSYKSAQEIKYKNPNLSYNAHHQLFRFYKEIKVGDYVIVYDKVQRRYILGEFTSDYKFRLKDGTGEHYREVKWFKDNPISRDSLSQSAKYSLGSLLTVTQVREDVKEEIFKLFNGDTKPNQNEDESADEILSFEENIRETIKEKILQIPAEEMEKFIAGVFRGMGYKTRIRGSFTAADGGYDIVASKDGLGLGDDTIYIEVKHRRGQIGVHDIASLRGVIGNNKGVYFSSGGFSKDAKNNTNDIVLIDLDYLVDLIFEYYDNFDTETQNMLPLKKIYIPNE